MADGSGGGGDVAEKIAADLGMVLSYGGQVRQRNGAAALCDLKLYQAKNAALLWHYATFLLKFTRNAGTGALEITVGTTFTLFTKGVGQAAAADTGYPNALTIRQTDALDEGSSVPQGYDFYVQALGARALHPFALDQSGNEVYSAWIDTYSGELRELALEAVSIVAKTKDGPCEWRVGTPSQWPTTGTPGRSDDIPTVGAGGGLMNVLPLRAELKSGARETSLTLLLTMKVENGLSVEQKLFADTESDVFVPIQIATYGYPDCASIVCATTDGGTVSKDELVRAVMQAMIGEFRNAGLQLPAGR